ncbi:bifunctional 4-hydroxy-2-oxoglutarate aldolase/2-dehydro-3-deoxy-phosphogluconate aldolase [Georgenia subflava]|uniref:2-dehydro-3-deoxy-phosphogluconate aldolase n=1 Tax=Georgenia subflava TaxID=1622177 RepID=A0A6N7EHF9_9MICO|nr:bifunctional 4-hydroxy-2-oxoglutarate aldolase/2-dehydro-3-deoxy-phosphogluconate aldolase [Georgenia subflava]MPV36085.1 bifunctional 4-hydroxy-2-oxoglutarate aldolase/2-dehydro-3-deoxy-phosphogluconate aldolase [Georgenia subflava]
MTDAILGGGETSAADAALLTRISAHRLLPVVVLEDAADAAGLGAALVAGGLPVAEVTFRTAAAADSVRAMVDAGLTEPDGPNLLVGAGTVVTPEQVDTAVAAGARFVVSPGLSRAVVERCQEHGVLVLPGTATATEVQAALTMGLRTVKFFPAESSGGVAAIKALTGPFPQMRFVPTGGIKESNVADYLAVPAVLAAGGSWMVPGSAVAAGDFAQVERLTAGAVALVAGS